MRPGDDGVPAAGLTRPVLPNEAGLPLEDVLDRGLTDGRRRVRGDPDQLPAVPAAVVEHVLESAHAVVVGDSGVEDPVFPGWDAGAQLAWIAGGIGVGHLADDTDHRRRCPSPGPVTLGGLQGIVTRPSLLSPAGCRSCTGGGRRR